MTFPFAIFPRTPPAGGNDAFTKILLHMDGTNGGTTFTDSNSGGSAHTWTAASATTDTGTVKFGTASMNASGGSKYITTPDHADFTLGSGDWTIDLWFNVTTGGSGTHRYFFGQGNSGGANTSVTAQGYIDASNFVGLYVGSGATLTNITTSTTAITTSGWHHYAAVRSGNTIYIFLDGVQQTSQAYSSTINDSAETYGVGRNGAYASNTFNGYIDEFRMSVGVARWTTAFTPPTIAYS